MDELSISQKIRFAFLLIIISIAGTTAFLVANFFTRNALIAYLGLSESDLALWALVVIVMGFVGIIGMNFAWPCPQCNRRLLTLPQGTLLKRGLFFPYVRLLGIIMGKRVECLHCGWKDCEGTDDGQGPKGERNDGEAAKGQDEGK